MASDRIYLHPLSASSPVFLSTTGTKRVTASCSLTTQNKFGNNFFLFYFWELFGVKKEKQKTIIKLAEKAKYQHKKSK